MHPDREEIARTIDPIAFRMGRNQTMVASRAARMEEALAKADAILSRRSTEVERERNEAREETKAVANQIGYTGTWFDRWQVTTSALSASEARAEKAEAERDTVAETVETWISYYNRASDLLEASEARVLAMQEALTHLANGTWNVGKPIGEMIGYDVFALAALSPEAGNGSENAISGPTPKSADTGAEPSGALERLRAAIAEADLGPAYSKPQGEVVTQRQTYTMTQEDLTQIIERISAARKVSGMWLSGGMPMSNVQEAANGAWAELGRRMGFDAMTVLPGGSDLQFTAVPTLSDDGKVRFAAQDGEVGS